MNKKLYLILSHEIDADSAIHSLIGVYTSLAAAVACLQKTIYDEFEENKEWWEEIISGEYQNCYERHYGVVPNVQK
jgi:hypothetical protein